MAPINFENDLKEKLEQRRLQPSANAWETLQSRLETNQVKKSNKTFWWLGIAASFVGILIVSSLFFNKNQSETIEPILVDTEEFQEPEINNKAIFTNNTEQQVVSEKTDKEKKTSKILKNTAEKSSELRLVIQQNQKALIKETNKETVSLIETEKQNDIKKEDNKAVTKLSFEDLKLLEVVAQVQELKKINNIVSDAEINALLDQAQKDIALHKLYNETTKKVDANALLQSVEDDLEQSFRDRAFKAIKSGYHYVKTSVAERNN